jgi:hypothetical protein
MKLFNLENPYSKENVSVTVNVRKYNNGRSALELLEFNPNYGYVPYATATVNMPDVLLADNEVLIKDYAENKGIYDFLVKHNIVTPTPNGVQSGFVWLPVAILNDESVWGDVPNAYCLNEEPEYDSAGFTNDDNTLDPAPDEINTTTGKSMWIIKDYRIWADNYQQALELLPLIESV